MHAKNMSFSSFEASRTIGSVQPFCFILHLVVPVHTFVVGSFSQQLSDCCKPLMILSAFSTSLRAPLTCAVHFVKPPFSVTFQINYILTLFILCFLFIYHNGSSLQLNIEEGSKNRKNPKTMPSFDTSACIPLPSDLYGLYKLRLISKTKVLDRWQLSKWFWSKYIIIAEILLFSKYSDPSSILEADCYPKNC